MMMLDSINVFKYPKTELRDATIDDIPRVQKRITESTHKFFNCYDLEKQFKNAIYAILLETMETGKLAAYANFENAPNISALPKGYWMDWMQKYYGLKEVTYGNTFFLTFLVTDDPYNSHLITDLFKEVFLREPKLKFICTVGPPTQSIYDAMLEVICKRIYPQDPNNTGLSQSIFICEKYDIIPKMQFRCALVEDNDDLVKIVDETRKQVRIKLGDFYIAESVLRDDPIDNIIVSEIAQTTIGMIWVNTNINHKVLAENFETALYGYFIRPDRRQSINVEAKAVTDVIRKLSQLYFDKTNHGTVGEYTTVKKLLEENRISMNNLYIPSDESSEISVSTADTDIPIKNLFQKWQQIQISFKTPQNYTDEVRKTVVMPLSTEMTNAFAIQLFGLSNTIDARRIFDMVAAAFALYPEKDYCIISLSSTEASSDTSSGPLLRYFSRVIPRPGCKVSECLFVTHRNSFHAEIEIGYLMPEDVSDIEDMLCHTAFTGKAMYYLADIMQSIVDYLENPHSLCDIMVMRCRNCAVGFALLRQNWRMDELRSNYLLFEDDDSTANWEAGKLKYLYLHPAFSWEWKYVVRELLRLSGYFSIYYTLIRDVSQPVLNTVLFNMFPIAPKKRTYRTYVKPYALYYLNIKNCHYVREQIENKIVIVGFNEACKGFLRTLIFSKYARQMQFHNITVITSCTGYIEAECDIKSFVLQKSMFFQTKNKYDANFLRKLEFRTWIRVIGGPMKELRGDAKCVVLANGTLVRYDQLYLMCSTRFVSPKPVTVVPLNYIEMNGRLDKIIFYHKIQLLRKELKEHTWPILIYGAVVVAHACVQTLIELGIEASQIYIVIPKLKGKIDFPEIFDDKFVSDLVYSMEQDAGVQVYKFYNFVDWKLHPEDDLIVSVIFESDFKRISLKCLAFISYHGSSLSEEMQTILKNSNINIIQKKIEIDQNSKTNIPDVYACGGIAQYQDKLFSRQIEQRLVNQDELGAEIAMQLMQERVTGIEQNLLEARFVKPIFRQSEIITGLVYGCLRKPGRYVRRDIRMNFQSYGRDLITSDDHGEYCRVLLDEKGFISNLTCLTRKYGNLEVLYRIYGLHQSMFNNLKTRFERGEIPSLLDYFLKGTFSVIIHDQFMHFRHSIRNKNLSCLNTFFENKKKIDKTKIQKCLRDNGMEESILNDLVAFIRTHSGTLSQYYVLPGELS